MPDDRPDNPSRRVLLARFAALAAVAPALLAQGCTRRLSCEDAPNLTPDERARRAAAHYMDSSPTGMRRCDNCQHFRGAAPGACGGCAVLRGPIHPEGWCALWAAHT